jgi:phycocyanin-associated, rod
MSIARSFKSALGVKFMTVSAVSGLNGLMDCMMKIDVTNMSARAATRTSAYAIKVPFSSLSRTMQFIHRSGGKVVEVTNLSAATALAELPPIATPVYTSTSSPKSKATATQPEQSRSKRDNKQPRR